jgi:hypothetical protein
MHWLPRSAASRNQRIRIAIFSEKANLNKFRFLFVGERIVIPGTALGEPSFPFPFTEQHRLVLYFSPPTTEEEEENV